MVTSDGILFKGVSKVCANFPCQEYSFSSLNASYTFASFEKKLCFNLILDKTQLLTERTLQVRWKEEKIL